jgi:CheY-like chemotaxis protein
MPSSRPSVLFAECDSVVRFAVTRNLRGCGFAVTAVGSIEEAQELLRTSSFDLVLSGLRFSASDALEGLRLLSFAGAAPGRPLRVLFAGKLQRSMADVAGAIGVDRIVDRADGLAGLGSAVRALLTGRGFSSPAGYAAAS